MVPLENGGRRWRPENREQRTENREQRTENREQRTERAASARRRNCRGVGRSPTEKAKPPSLQTSKLPIAPAPPARLRRAIKTTTGDSGDAGDTGAPGKRATDETAFQETTGARGMGTLVRAGGPNGEVPRPLRNLVSSWRGQRRRRGRSARSSRSSAGVRRRARRR